MSDTKPIPAARPATRDGSGDVLAMLEVKSSDALPAWLGARLREHCGGSAPRVLRVYPARAARIKGVAGPEAFSIADVTNEGQVLPVPAGGDELMLGALRQHRPIAAALEAGEPRLLATFEAGGEARYVVELRGGAPRPEETRALVAVARKYFERLVDGETDPLTRLANRRLFQSHLEAGVKRWSSAGHAYYFAMLDLDHFKKVNDEFGHLYGDEILVHFANLMRASFRSGDQLYRFGGEEFVVVFRVEPPDLSGEPTVERFRKAVEEYAFPGGARVTVSVGFTRVADVSTPAAVLIDRADEALYYAKAHGRNKVCGWEALVAAGELKFKEAPKGDVTLF